MNVLRTIMACLIVLVPLTTRGQGVGHDTLSVLTYNIHGLLADGSPPEWDPDRAAWMVEAIAELDPDIVGFQEVLQSMGSDGSDNQLRVLAEALSEATGHAWSHRIAMSHVSWDRFEEGLGILTKHPIVDSDERALVAKDRLQRKVLAARIETPLGEVEFITTHHAYHGEADSVRTAQVVEVKEFALERAGSEIPLIVLGDFNAEPGRPPIVELTRDDGPLVLADVWQSIGKDATTSDPGYTFSASEPKRRIDYVLVAPGRALYPASAEVVFHEARGGAYLSDHLGVLAKFVRPD